MYIKVCVNICMFCRVLVDFCSDKRSFFYCCRIPQGTKMLYLMCVFSLIYFSLNILSSGLLHTLRHCQRERSPQLKSVWISSWDNPRIRIWPRKLLLCSIDSLVINPQLSIQMCKTSGMPCACQALILMLWWRLAHLLKSLNGSSF